MLTSADKRDGADFRPLPPRLEASPRGGRGNLEFLRSDKFAGSVDPLGPGWSAAQSLRCGRLPVVSRGFMDLPGMRVLAPLRVCFPRPNGGTCASLEAGSGTAIARWRTAASIGSTVRIAIRKRSAA